jgi:3,4-dihydroxy 2-butanone 4-phosphate synthase/GTP cyclohydrolase II
MTYIDKSSGDEHLVLTKGSPTPDRPTLVRVHTIDPLSDLVGGKGARGGLIHGAMQAIGDAGGGVLLLLRRGGSDAMARALRATGGSDMDELRNYGIGAQILADLGVHDMVLLSNSHHTLVALSGYGLNIAGERAIPTGRG